jgi:hypothetical protein
VLKLNHKKIDRYKEQNQFKKELKKMTTPNLLNIQSSKSKLHYIKLRNFGKLKNRSGKK